MSQEISKPRSTPARYFAEPGQLELKFIVRRKTSTNGYFMFYEKDELVLTREFLFANALQSCELHVPCMFLNELHVMCCRVWSGNSTNPIC